MLLLQHLQNPGAATASAANVVAAVAAAAAAAVVAWPLFVLGLHACVVSLFYC